MMSRLRAVAETPRSWDECRTFLEVTRSTSFANAADVLGLSTPTISRHVKRLEDLAGVRLVISSAGGVELTAEGRLFAERLRGVEREVKRALFGINRDSVNAQRLVRVSVTDGLLSCWLLPSFGTELAPPKHLNFDFLKPDQPLRSGGIQASSQAVDILIMMNNQQQAGWQQIALGYLHFLPLASARYLRERGKPTVETAAEHDFIQLNIDDALDDLRPGWRQLRSAGRVSLRFDGSLQVGFAAGFGSGIALLGNYALLHPQLRMTGLPICHVVRIFAAVREEQLSSAPVVDALAWIQRLLGEENPWFGETLHVGDPPSLYDTIGRRAFDFAA